MSENFSELFNQSELQESVNVGSIVNGKVIKIDNNFAMVDIGPQFKACALVPKGEFDGEEEVTLDVGSEFDFYIVSLDTGMGDICVSYDKAQQVKQFIKLEEAQKSGEKVEGKIIGRVKGGFTVALSKNITAFLPGSQIAMDHSASPEGMIVDLKVIKLDMLRNNIVVSHKALLSSDQNQEASKILAELKEGQVVKGTVKSLKDYGAFVDIGGVDGLVHITDLAWYRVNHPSEIIKLGQELDLSVLKIDRETNRISLGLKQLEADPWNEILEKYEIGQRLPGKVTTVMDYGAFVQIAPHVEGLVHVSEMSWVESAVAASKHANVGQEVEVQILDINPEKRRISLGMKQCTQNPWASFDENHSVGETITGIIKSITDFGIFVGLDGGIDGLIHLSDLSWTGGDEAIKKYKKGDEIKAKITNIDSTRERISLSVKELENSPYDSLNVNDEVTGKVTHVGDNALTVLLNDANVTVKMSKTDPEAEGKEVDAEVTAFYVGFDGSMSSGKIASKKATASKPKAKRAAPVESEPQAKLGDLFKFGKGDES